MTEPLLAWVARLSKDPKGCETRLAGRCVLVYEPPEVEPTGDGDSDYQFRTVSGITPVGFGGGQPMVFLLTKTRDNAFQRRITVGRTSNNDLPVDDGSVSRFHAWFQRADEVSSWHVVDAGSKNGTTLNGRPLAAKKPQALESGARVRVGKVELTFFDASGFLRLLKQRLVE